MTGTGTVKLDLKFQQGATFSKGFLLTNVDGTPKNLTGYLARLQVRATREAVTPLLEATTENGRITITAVDGLVAVTVGADVLAPMTWRSGVWDLEVYTSAANVLRPFEGFASLSLEVTR
jgi:hypothetical protein